jgi:hypothetical protein
LTYFLSLFLILYVFVNLSASLLINILLFIIKNWKWAWEGRWSVCYLKDCPQFEEANLWILILLYTFIEFQKWYIGILLLIIINFLITNFAYQRIKCTYNTFTNIMNLLTGYLSFTYVFMYIYMMWPDRNNKLITPYAPNSAKTGHGKHWTCRLEIMFNDHRMQNTRWAMRNTLYTHFWLSTFF